MNMLYAFDGSDKDLPAAISITTDGFVDARPCGRLEQPLALNDSTPAALAAFATDAASLQLTLFRPGSETVVGDLQADDAISLCSTEREYGDFIDARRRLLLPPGTTHLIIRIDPMLTTQGNRNFDFSQLQALTLDFKASPEHPVYIRSVRLCAETETIAPPVEPQAGDSIFYMQHQDIACYTYELKTRQIPAEIVVLEQDLGAEMQTLQRHIRIAQLGGKQTLYAEAALLCGEIALDIRALYPWTNHVAQRQSDLDDALRLIAPHTRDLDLYARGILHEDDEDDSNLPVPKVPAFPDYQSLRRQDHAFVDRDERPVLLYAMNYHNDGPLCCFFAPANHRVESYAVGGGSRYDIEWSPVYRTFHQYPETHRVGYRGWCGHLIKDQWAMGGRKENMLICLESEEVRRAISQYNRQHQHEWRHNPHLLYHILAYELMYICYCEKSAALYRQWLKEKYADIDQLNSRWQTNYNSFSIIPLPAAPDGVPPANLSRGAWYDWTSFNTRRFSDILLWARDDIRQLDNNIALCSGGTHSMTSPNNGNTGIDEELIINEVDDVILHEGGDLLSLDLLRALSDTPKPVVDPEHGGKAWGILQNFLHGKSTISKFWWPKQPSRQFPQMTLSAPMQGLVPLPEVEEHLRCALDVRRLSNEISLFWSLAAEVALLYSKTNILQVPYDLLKASSTPYLQALRHAYNDARHLDTPITFVSERQLLEAKKTPKILVLPACHYLPEPVFCALDTYVQQGGTLVLLPAGPQADEYARPQDYLTRWGLNIQTTHQPSIEGRGPTEQGYDQSIAHKIHIGPGHLQTSTYADPVFFSGSTASTHGLFEEIAANDADILAATADHPLLLRQTIGKGSLYYFCGMPTPDTYRRFMDALIEQSNIYRPLRLTAPDGSRLSGVEARLVHTQYYDLVYLTNETSHDIEFTLKTNRPYQKVRELRSLSYWDTPTGTLAAHRTLLFKLMLDPTQEAQSPTPSHHPYHGL